MSDTRKAFFHASIGFTLGVLATIPIYKKVFDEKDYLINRLQNLLKINNDLAHALWEQMPDQVWLPQKLINDMEAFRILDSNDLA